MSKLVIAVGGTALMLVASVGAAGAASLLACQNKKQTVTVIRQTCLKKETQVGTVSVDPVDAGTLGGQSLAQVEAGATDSTHLGGMTLAEVEAGATDSTHLEGKTLTEVEGGATLLENKSVNDILGLAALPPGVVLPFAGDVTSPPAGWLVCDGSAVSRTQYAALFTAVGTAHGAGDGTTTFNLPDYRGLFLRGVDSGVGNDPDAASRVAAAAGGNTGDLVGSVQADDFKSHTHDAKGTADVTAGIGTSVLTATANTPASLLATGGNETRPKNAGVHWLIKI